MSRRLLSLAVLGLWIAGLVAVAAFAGMRP